MMIDYDLGEKKIIKNINFLMDSQYCLNEYEILVSQDGYNYYKYNNNLEEGVRYVRIYSSSKTDKKLIINKLEVIYD